MPFLLPSRLYVVCDAEGCAARGLPVADYAAACLDGGARLLQVRAKTLSGAELLDRAAAIAALGRSAGALVIVNDRADVARLAGAGGVHVGQDDLTPAQARTLVGAGAIVGLSTHTPEQLRRGLDEPADYLAIGPVFETATKATGYRAIGLDGVRAAAEALGGRRPLVAIGGITLERARSVVEAGAQAVAVISDLMTDRPADRVRAFLDALR